ncbi:MAG TPA: hypothetical protein P5232_02030 [Candidatus Moranbacteria bacterium]|nr:hypothetical protein [Candidatus Moranbacteria bacterium]
MKKKILGASGVVLLALIFSGCGAGDAARQKAGEAIMERAIESQTGGKVDINSGKNTMDITTGEGKMSVSNEGEGKLPESFPKDIFIFSDAKITLSTSNTTGTGSLSVSYSTKSATQNEAMEKYKTEMTGSGWTKETEMNFGTDQGAIVNFKKDSRSVAVTIGKDENGSTFISVIVVAE